MAVEEPQRLALHAAARATLGEKEGDTLMALTPPANTDIATTQHLDRVEITMTGAMRALEERVSAAMSALEERMNAATRALEERMNAQIELSALRTRLWTFGAIVAAHVASLTYLTNMLG